MAQGGNAMSREQVTDKKISCRSLWKAFGPDPKGFLRRHNGAPADEAFRNEGYIGAVRDVSFEVDAHPLHHPAD
jgi:ABC-type proline/glycine betaine transport system ATPase subunit